MLGGVLGAFLSIFCICVVFLMSDRLNSEKELKKRFGKNVFATKEEKTLEEAVVDLLKEKNMTLSLAESCTGGAVAARMKSWLSM